MNIIIVGGGRTLYFLSRRFASKGHSVTLVNRNREECTTLARSLKADVIHGDGSDPQVLEDAGARGADVVMAITPNDQDNLVICQIADVMYTIPRAIALVNDPDNEEAFRSMGVSAFSLTQLISNLIEQRASVDEITNLVPVGEGRVNVTEVRLTADSPVVGKQLRELELPENALIAVILRDNTAIVPRGSNRLEGGDRVVLITVPENHGPVLKMITGEQD